MRILHLSDHYLPVLGGIETHVAALAARQAERGDEVCVLTSTPPDADGWHSDDHGPVRVHRAGSVLAALRHDLGAHDVVHAHVSVLAPFSSPVVAWASRRGVPTVVTVHSFWDGMGPTPVLVSGVLGLRSAPVHWTAVSRAAADRLAPRLPRATPVAVVPNAVEVAARPWTPWPADRPVRLVSTMRIARRKRPRQLVETFAAVRAAAGVPVQLTIIGDGGMRPRLEHDLDRLGLRADVEITGRLEPAEVLEVLAGCDVYVAPALLESFGLAALEARSVGLPVVGMRASGIPEFVTDGVEGLLCDSDEELARALVRLATDDGLRLGIAEHNRTTPSRLTWAHALERTDLAYATAQEHNGAPRRPLVAMPS